MKTEQSHNDSEKQAMWLANNLPVATIVTDMHGQIIASNRQACNITGFTAEEMREIPVTRIFYKQGNTSNINLGRDRENRRRTDVETVLRNNEQEEVLVWLSRSDFCSDEGLRVGITYCFGRIEQLKGDPTLLLKVSEIVNQAENLQEGMQHLAEMITLHLSSSFCRILLLDKTGKVLIPRAAYHTQRENDSFKWNARLGEEAQLDDWPKLEDRLIEGKTHILKADNPEDDYTLRQLTKRLQLDQPIQSLLSIPLRSPDKVVGLLHVGEIRGEQSQTFTKEKEEVATAIAAQVLHLLDSLRLKETSRLNKFAQSLISSTEIEDMFEQIIAGTKAVLNADSTFLWSYDKEQDKLTLESLPGSALLGYPSDGIPKITPGKQGTAAAIMQREWVGVSDVNDTDRYGFIGPNTRKMLEDNEVQSFQGMALKVGDEDLGVLYVNYKSVHTFDDDIKNTALAFANHVALALKTLRLRDQIDTAKATIEVARKASEATANAIRTMTKEDHKQTLKKIAQGTYDVLHCDAVVLFTYDQSSHILDHPPTMINVYYPGKAMSFEDQLSESIVNKILEYDIPYMVEDISVDNSFKDRRFAREEGIKSCIAVPLKVGMTRVGVMFVNYRTLHRFTSEDLTNIEIFANHAAVAIRNAQLFRDQSRSLNEQKLLADISESVLQSANPENIPATFNHAVAKTAEALDTEFCNIVLPDENGELVFSAAYGWPSSLIGTYKLAKGKGSHTGLTIETEEPVVVYDYTTETRLGVLPLVHEHGIKSGLSVPIMLEGRIIGAMLAHTKRQRQFTDADVQLLGLIADQCAMLLSIVQKYEQIQHHNANLTALHGASEALASLTVKLSLRQVLDSILQQAVACMSRGSQRKKIVFGTIQLYNKDTNELVFESIYPTDSTEKYAEVGEKWSVIDPQANEKKIGITGRAFWAKEPQLVAKVSEDPDYNEYNPTTQSELAVPLKVGDKEVIGVLDLESELEGGFDESDKNLLMLLAKLSVIAIQSARQNQDLQQAREVSATKNALVWMGMNSSYWRHTIQGKATAICDGISNIIFMLDTEPPSAIKSRLEDILEPAKIIESSPSSEPLSAEELGELDNINTLLTNRIEQLQTRSSGAYQQITIRWGLTPNDNIQAKANSNWLIKALDVLFDNAKRAMSNSKKKELLISTHMSETSIVIEIADTGPGIDLELLPGLFKERIRHEKGSKRLGMGLLMAQFIVQVYGGNIWIVKSDSEGTTIAVSLPIAEKKQV